MPQAIFYVCLTFCEFHLNLNFVNFTLNVKLSCQIEDRNNTPGRTSCIQHALCVTAYFTTLLNVSTHLKSWIFACCWKKLSKICFNKCYFRKRECKLLHKVWFIYNQKAKLKRWAHCRYSNCSQKTFFQWDEDEYGPALKP